MAKRKEKLIKRLFEILPGAIAWLLITSPVWGGIFFPEIIAYLVLIFDAFWLYKSLSIVVLFVIGYFRIRDGENTDWMARLSRIADASKGQAILEQEISAIRVEKFSTSSFRNSTLHKLPVLFQKILFNLEKNKAIKSLQVEKQILGKKNGEGFIDPRQIHQIVIIPFWKEPYEVLERCLDKLVAQTFSTKQISIVLGAEARHPPAYELGQKLAQKYKQFFEHVWVNNHTLSGDDIIGKASNMASCGRFVREQIVKLGWNKSRIVVTSSDCDTQFDKGYFAYLTYQFILDSNRYTHFYAAPMVYYANIWRVPFYSRVANTLFTINNIATSARPDKFIQIASYSFSWKLLEDINFWSVDIIPEDFHMFFKALFVHGDKVQTVPIYLKNFSDAAESIGHLGTIKNQYEQVKRWAWGVSDDGWMIRELLAAKKKTLYMTYRVFHTIFDHFTWSIISFILLFGANIPPLVNKEFSRTVFGQKLPQVSSFILTLSTAAFVVVILLDFFVKPRRKNVSIARIILEQLQWITFPVVSFVFGAIPGLDAQTRLLLGKHMEYRLTEKH